MPSKRLLFIQDDLFLSSFYRDQMESAGFTVETARDVDSGLKLMEEIRPDLVVVDPVLSTGAIGGVVQAIRRSGFGAKLPVLVMPTPHIDEINSDPAYGPTHLLSRSRDRVMELMEATEAQLKMPGASDRSQKIVPSGLDTEWRATIVTTAEETLTGLRQKLHEFMRAPNAAGIRDLLNRAHSFGEQIALLGQSALVHVANAVEVLLNGLEVFPERMNPVTLRTLGQACDFLAVLMEKEAYQHPLDLSDAHIMIVEDEAGARDMISAAMSMVGLNSDGLETPGASLAVLSASPCDLIFLDVNLPEMNGFELCAQLRQIPMHENTPILFLTGFASFQNRVQSNLSGGNDFISKPFNLAELGVKALLWVIKGRLGIQ
jgi:DNA-binding response OmpR family regulator